MTQDDVLFGYRLQLFDLAARTTVAHACRTFGVHRSTYYRWKRSGRAFGVGDARPRERRRPQMPNQLSAMVEQRIVAFALGHPGLGPRRVAAQLARGRNGVGCWFSPNGVYKTLVPARPEHARQAPGVGRRLPRALRAAARPGARAAHRQRPGRASWSASTASSSAGCTAPRARSGRSPRSTPTARFAWADLVVCPPAGPTVEHTSALARRVASELQHGRLAARARAHRQRQRVRPPRIRSAPTRRRRAQPDPLRAPADQRPRRTTAPHDPRRMLAPRLRALPASPLQRPTPRPRRTTCTTTTTDRAHTGRITAGRCPADLVYGARKMEPR